MTLPAAVKAKKPTSHPSTCRDEVKLIGAYLAGDLSAKDSRAFESHLEACRDCGAFLSTYKKTIEMTRSFMRGGPASQQRLQLRQPL